MLFDNVRDCIDSLIARGFLAYDGQPEPLSPLTMLRITADGHALLERHRLLCRDWHDHDPDCLMFGDTYWNGGNTQ